MPKNHSPQKTAIRRTIHFQGHVQGVGFRYAARTIATSFSVTGYVKNLQDGRVELVAEGAHDELDLLQREVERALQKHIRSAAVHDEPSTGQFAGFEIAR